MRIFNLHSGGPLLGSYTGYAVKFTNHPASLSMLLRCLQVLSCISASNQLLALT